MENERRYVIKNVKKLEGDYQKYQTLTTIHTKINSALIISYAALAAVMVRYGVDVYSVISPDALNTICYAGASTVSANGIMLISRLIKKRNTARDLNEAYDAANIPEEERIIENEGRSK